MAPETSNNYCIKTISSLRPPSHLPTRSLQITPDPLILGSNPYSDHTGHCYPGIDISALPVPKMLKVFAQ